MARIFFVLAIVALTLLISNIVLGWNTGDFGGATRELLEAGRAWDQAERSLIKSESEKREVKQEFDAAIARFKPMQRTKNIHVWGGIAAALMTLLVNSIAITYFIGTVRWSREVVEAFGFEHELVGRSARLKRRSFAWATVSMLVIMCIAALGALSDPTANPRIAAQWVTVHFMTAIAGTVLIAWSFLVQIVNIGANYDIVEQVMTQVKSKEQPAEDA